ncbi:cell separation during budding, partial [Coemansia sp. RSA 1694]
MGKDWYRFPSSFWLPPNHRLQFIESPAFDGHLPGDYTPVWVSGSTKMSTSMKRPDFNSMNIWEPTHAIPSNMTAEVCDYVVDVEYPSRGIEAPIPRGEKWQRIAACEPILDSEHTPLLARVVYVPAFVLRLLPWKQQWEMSDNNNDHPGLGASTHWLLTQAKDLVEDQQVIQVNSDATIEEACDALIKHNIQSVPLYDQKTQTYIGMFDLHDLATYILLKRGGKAEAESDSDSSSSNAIQLQAAAARSSASGLARDAVLMGKKRHGDSVSLLSDMSHMNPFYSVLPETTLAQVVGVFAKGTHRVAVMDNGRRIRGILSQTRVIRYFFEHCAAASAPPVLMPGSIPADGQLSSSEARLLDTPLRDLGLVTNDVVKARPTTPIIQALSLLERWHISSLAIVDEEDRIVGNLSVADVKYLAKERRLTGGTCMELIQAARFVEGMRDGRDRAAVFSVRPEATLRYALTKLIATGAHRVWVTEPRQQLP